MESTEQRGACTHFSSNSFAFCLASAFASAAFSDSLYCSSSSAAFASAAAFASLTNATQALSGRRLR